VRLPPSRRGFTLVEVLLASFILVLFPVGAVMTTLRLEQFARVQTERMAAAAFCEDVYNRCLREENFAEQDWRNLAASGIPVPEIRLKGSTEWVNPLKRGAYREPQYRITVKAKNARDRAYDVRVSLRWGALYENVYHRESGD